MIYWLNTKVAINLLKRLASIATIAYVNNPTLLRLQIPLPDITIQNEEQVFCEIHGKMIRVTDRRLTRSELVEIISFIYKSDEIV